MNNYKNKDWLIQKYINEKLSMRKIANICGVTCFPIFIFLKKYEIPTREQKITFSFLGYKHSEDAKRKMRIAHTGEKNNRWKGGQFKNPLGYIYKLNKEHPNGNQDGYIAEHRLVAEKILHRFLIRNEEVHHINFDRADNRPQNLLICTHSYHKKLHIKIKRLGLENYFKSLAHDSVLKLF